MTDNNPHENRQLAMLDRSFDATRAPSRAAMPSSPRAIHAGDVALMPLATSVPKLVAVSPPKSAPASDPPKEPVISAKAIKCTIGLDPHPLAKVRVGNGDRTVLTIEVDGRRVTADLSSKSVRKAQTTIREHGAANVFCGVVGKLMAGDVLAEAGLSAQVKAPMSPKDAA